MDKIILCDLDGTIWDDNEAIKKASLEVLGKELDRKDVRKLPKEVKSKIYSIAFTKYKSLLKKNNNVVKFLEEHKRKGYKIIILTARLRDLLKDTEESLKMFKIPYDQILLRENKNIKDEIWKKGIVEKYARICKEVIFIDDKDENIELVKSIEKVKAILAQKI